jgi:hypothetical protein
MWEMFAHETCHVVAAVKELRPDPSHLEYGGKIAVLRSGAAG